MNAGIPLDSRRKAGVINSGEKPEAQAGQQHSSSAQTVGNVFSLTFKDV